MARAGHSRRTLVAGDLSFPMTESTKPATAPVYQLFMLGLCVLAPWQRGVGWTCSRPSPLSRSRGGDAWRASRGSFGSCGGLRATRLLTGIILRKRSQSTFAAAGLLALLFVIAGSTAILHFETAPESNIRTADDAIWWAISTITTVGYGDRYPVTTEGRFVAALLLITGVGLFGTRCARRSRHFVRPWSAFPLERLDPRTNGRADYRLPFAIIERE
jgi:hypothetical protein